MRLNKSRRSWLIGLAAMGNAIVVGLLKDNPTVAQETSPRLKSFHFEVVQLNAQGQIQRRTQHLAQKFAVNLSHDIQLEMVAIPGGKFIMGAPPTEANSRDVERPQHLVQLPGFYLGRYPITQAQWQAVMGNNPAHFPGENLPVETVSWLEAVKFCTKLAALTGQPYRLPTEAEWEYACRAGTTTAFHYGETISTAVANYNGQFAYGQGKTGKSYGQTTPVDHFPANAFGLHDMHGNVWEWCADRWHDNYQGQPQQGKAWTAGESEFKVLRGGSWLGHPQFFRSACRYGDGFDPELALSSIGLRVCLDLHQV